MLKIKRALISVYYKDGLLDFAKALKKYNVEIISTGGTFKFLKENGIEVTSISDVTGFPEILDGRVKTLHPNIHSGILAKLDNEDHVKQLSELKIKPIDLVCINLYPFEETVKKAGISDDEIIEQIDIGGPSMLRSASKNYKFTAAICSTNQYLPFIEELDKNEGSVSETFCRELAREVFRITAYYDSLIFEYFDRDNKEETFPDTITIAARREYTLRYGENPHQKSALYGSFSEVFEKLHGKELSYNNILDISSTISLLNEFKEPTAVIVKHNNPCGVAVAKTLFEAYSKALETDPKSAFGGIIAVNGTLDVSTAEKINEIFSEVVIALDYPPEVLELLQKKKDRRLIKFKPSNMNKEKFQVRNVIGGYLLQDLDSKLVTEADIKVVTNRKPNEEELQALLFGWKVVKHVKSNAIVFTSSNQTLGIGVGQMSRVDATKIAIMKAEDNNLSLKNSALASDAYFPFADSIIEATKVGVTAVIQPGGSVRDKEVIDVANAHNIAMLFTGVRHFMH